MIINIQAFNAAGKDNRRIYEVLDDFQSRRPIDVISANRPIVIIDEPQKIGAARSLEALSRFNPLMILRYSATHKVEHNKVHRLDALDAYHQKLVKKIAVRGITVQGLAGTRGLPLPGRDRDRQGRQAAGHAWSWRCRPQGGIKRQLRRLEPGREPARGLRRHRGVPGPASSRTSTPAAT